MKRVLVTTDFSDNSVSAINFAKKWAEKEKLWLEFVYVLQPERAREWHESDFQKFIKHETLIYEEKLKNFVQSVFNDENNLPENSTYKVITGITADNTLIEYCDQNPEIEYICISTRGAGGLQKFLGTNTGNLIIKSKIPVIAVPSKYDFTDFEKVLYASDLTKYEDEIAKVIAVAKPLQVPIDILNFYWPNEDAADETLRQKLYVKDYEYGFNLKFYPHNVSHTLAENIQHYINENKPSLAVMFTNKQKREKTFWQKLLNPSKTEKVSFEIKVPLLVFKK